ncbi:hypothetical protein ACOB9N_03980 [Pasteurella multocida]|uniref:hypothetical protein n=1 Tax=Pasteurella multocida TaxID=747 RepID=UPI003BA069E7
MAYEKGVASTERDLLDKLNTFLTTHQDLVGKGQAWTKLFDRTLSETNLTVARRQIAWKATGTGVGQDIYVGAETVNSIAEDVYNITFFGGTFFNADLIKNEDIKTGFINISPAVALFCDARNFEYHFVANGRHFKIATHISKVTSTAYCGFILPTVPPTEYPYPICIAGSGPDAQRSYSGDFEKWNRYSNNDKYNSSIAMAKHENCWLMTPDQTWYDFYADISGGSYSREQAYRRLYPLKSVNDYKVKYVFARFTGLDCSPLIPIEFISTENSSQGVNRWGAYDGVYWIPGIQRATGDVVTLKNGGKGIVLNDGYRTSTTSYFVFETESEA